MDPVIVPKLTMSFVVDIDLEYDSYQGRTPSDIAIALQDTLDDLLFEANPNVIGVYTTLTAINNND